MEEVSDQKLLLSWFQPGANSPFSPCIYNLQAALLPLDSERCEARLVALHLYRLSRAVHTVRIFATPWLQARQITAIMQGTRREGIFALKQSLLFKNNDFQMSFIYVQRIY